MSKRGEAAQARAIACRKFFLTLRSRLVFLGIPPSIRTSYERDNFYQPPERNSDEVLMTYNLNHSLVHKNSNGIKGIVKKDQFPHLRLKELLPLVGYQLKILH